MLCESNLPRYFQAKAINTVCYILNRALIRPILKKTPYELWKGRKSNIVFFHIFGCRCFILNNGKERLEKFDAKFDEAIFLDYFSSSKIFRVFNKKTLVVEESIHVIFYETNDLPSKKNEDINDVDPLIEGMKEITLKDSIIQNEEEHENKQEDEGEEQQEQPQDTNDLPKEQRYDYNHPKELIIGDPTHGVRTHSSLTDAYNHFALVSHFEPKIIDEAEKDYN